MSPSPTDTNVNIFITTNNLGGSWWTVNHYFNIAGRLIKLQNLHADIKNNYLSTSTSTTAKWNNLFFTDNSFNGCLTCINLVFRWSLHAALQLSVHVEKVHITHNSYFFISMYTDKNHCKFKRCSHYRYINVKNLSCRIIWFLSKNT